MKKLHISKFLADGLILQFDTLVEKTDPIEGESELIKGTFKPSLLDINELKVYLDEQYDNINDSNEEINSFKNEIKNESEVFVFWES